MARFIWPLAQPLGSTSRVTMGRPTVVRLYGPSVTVSTWRIRSRSAAAVGPSPQDYVQNYYRYLQRLVSNTDKTRLFNAAVADELRHRRDGEAVPFRDHTLTVFRRVFGDQVIARFSSD